MDQFVCVRLVRAENLDLSIFKFDPDLSFAVFFLGPDMTVYGRYGTRSDFYDAERDISLEGLKKATEKALEWHKRSELKELFVAKKGAPAKYKTLADFPSTRPRGRGGRGGRGGGRGGRCTHCHDLRTAEQFSYRNAGEPMPENVIFSWPLPDAAGLTLAPKEIATVEKVWENSPAEQAGFKPGDEITKLDGQPILSIADVQWVLHNAGIEDDVNANVIRDGKPMSIEMHLDKDWRRYVDISWRTTTGVLRRNLLGGIEYRDLPEEARKELGLAKHVIALRASRGVSRNSGEIRRDDVIVAVDGKDTFMFEADLIAYLAQKKKRGDEIQFTLLREGERINVKIPVNY